ncbi:MAG TPA: helix-turn-helix domain-containing protein [Ignavibacteria bacterium]|nr:helix-turn-helix domain-containing protein [Ignavibacteria bacterium]
MKNLAIIIPENAVLASITDPHYMFSAVNQLLFISNKKPAFKITLVGFKKKVNLNNGLFTVNAQKNIDEIKKTDLIIIPAISGDFNETISLNQKYIDWIKKLYQNGAEVASLCVGSFLLASTGLLNGLKSSTHWMYVEKFRKMFPDVILEDDKIITDEKRIYTSGGASSYWNLLLYLVEKFTDRETAILASKYFELDINRVSQSPFTIFRGQKEHNDDVIKNVQEYIEKNYDDKLSVSELADLFNLGRRTFERRFKQATNNTIIQYIQRVKIEAAKSKLELGNKTVSEVMFEVGYSDIKSYREVFKRITKLTPVEYRNKYSKSA